MSTHHVNLCSVFLTLQTTAEELHQIIHCALPSISCDSMAGRKDSESCGSRSRNRCPCRDMQHEIHPSSCALGANRPLRVQRRSQLPAVCQTDCLSIANVMKASNFTRPRCRRGRQPAASKFGGPGPGSEGEHLLATALFPFIFQSQWETDGFMTFKYFLALLY